MSNTVTPPEPAADVRTMTDSADHNTPSDDPSGSPHGDASDAKGALRREMRSRLAAMTDDERHAASSAACARLMNLSTFRHASVVMLYMPLASEVDTTPIAIRCFRTGKIVCVPRVSWRRKDMSAVEVTTFDDHFMETDEHGLRSPVGGQLLPPSAIDLVIVPALAFDTLGNRLGRGGGYYDRFLQRLRRSATCVGFAFDTQIVDEVPIDGRDVNMDVLVSDRRVTYTRRSRTKS